MQEKTVRLIIKIIEFIIFVVLLIKEILGGNHDDSGASKKK